MKPALRDENEAPRASSPANLRGVRVAIDCRYIRERPSGIGAYVQALIDRLPSLAPEANFHLWADPRARLPLSASPNVRHTIVRAAANSLPTLLWPARLAPLRDAHVFHAPSNILGRGIPCPTVVTVHDVHALLPPSLVDGLTWATPFQVPFFRDGLLRALRSATRIVAISEATAASIAAVMPSARDKVRVILHGVDERFRPAESDELARAQAARVLGFDEPYFLVVGQNAPYKNHGQVIEAFAASGLKQRARLVLVQRLKPDGALHKRVRALGIEQSARFFPSISGDDIIALMRGALALIQFSRYEGFGMPAAEAMACGAPVIASDIPALREVLGGAGRIVPLDVAALASDLRLIAGESSLRAELRARGLERARALSWDRSAASHAEVYREAAERGS